MAGTNRCQAAAAPNERLDDSSKPISAHECVKLDSLVGKLRMPWKKGNGLSRSAKKRGIGDVNNPISTASKQTKLDEIGSSETRDEESEPGALDQRQLESIGYDRNLLEDLKAKLDDAIEEVGARDLAKLKKLIKMQCKVEDRLAALNEVHLENPNGNQVAWTTADVLPLSEVLPKSSAIVYRDVHTRSRQATADCEKDSDDVLMPSEKELIKLQEERAKQQLQSFQASPEEGQSTTNAAVQTALDDGRVKPIFHALFLPKTFLNNHRSCCVVIAGDVDEKQTLEFDFDANDLVDVVNVDAAGHASGVGSIIDHGMASPWTFHSKQAAFTVELVNSDAVMLGEGIECTKLTSIPIKINPGEHLDELLTRPESRGIVSSAFHQFANEAAGGSVVAITGTPGIGKSWALFYALQQALLYDGATVLFFYQKSSSAVLYLRRNNKMYAWASKRKDAADSCLFNRQDALVLLDPREAKNGGASFRLGETKLLYAASNNEAHFKNAADKNNGKMHTFLGPPLNSELPIIMQHLFPSLAANIIKERMENVGNLIRYVSGEDIYTRRIAAIRKAVAICARDYKVLERALQVEGMCDGENTNPGTLFHVLPKRPVNPGATGYDGQGIDYRERVLLAANRNVRDAILKSDRPVIRRYWRRVGCHQYEKKGLCGKVTFVRI